jgi:hypothetical protein
MPAGLTAPDTARDRCKIRYGWQPTDAVLRMAGACIGLRAPVPARVPQALAGRRA